MLEMREPPGPPSRSAGRDDAASPGTMSRLGLRLTPHGRFVLEAADDAPLLEERVAARLTEAFAEGSGQGLLQLGAGEVGRPLPPVFLWWRDFAARYVNTLRLSSGGAATAVPALSEADLVSLALTAPMANGNSSPSRRS